MNEILITDLNGMEGWLKKHFPVVMVPADHFQEADFLLGDTFTSMLDEFKGVRILHTNENHPIDLNRFDYCITHEIIENDRCHRFPCWLYHTLQKPQWQDRILNRGEDLTAESLSAEGRDFCAFVCKNPVGKERNSLVRHLMKHKRVSCGGPFMNNIGYTIPRSYELKQEFLHKHLFTVAYENESSPGYQTEKIIDPFVARSIPIYWGNERVAEEFNPASFVHARDFKTERDLVEYIIELSEDPARMAAMLNEPVVQDPDVFKKTEQELVDFFARIFERGPGSIQRTPAQMRKAFLQQFYGHGLFRTIRRISRKIRGKK